MCYPDLRAPTLRRLQASCAGIIAGEPSDHAADPDPSRMTVVVDAVGSVDRNGVPVADAHVGLIRCTRAGEDDLEEARTVAMATTGPDGRYELSYLCVFDPLAAPPRHSLLVELPDITGREIDADPGKRLECVGSSSETVCVERIRIDHERHFRL